MSDKYNTPYHTPMGDGCSSDDGTVISSTSDNGELSIVAEYEDLIRCIKHRRNDEVEDTLLEMAEQLLEVVKRWEIAVQECERLCGDLEKKTQDCSDLENKLKIARKLLDQERKHAWRAEEEKEQLEEQLQKVRNLLFKDTRSHVADEIKTQLSFLNSSSKGNVGCSDDVDIGVKPQLSTIQEVNTTGSLLSDLSYSRSEDDLDVSILQGGKTWKKHRPSTDFAAPPPKKRKSADAKVVEISTTETVRATTTLTVPKEGPITATSVIESIPSAEVDSKSKTPGGEGSHFPTTPLTGNVRDYWMNDDNNVTPSKRLHAFQVKIVVMPEMCTVCEKRIGFGKSMVKCAICRSICHVECQSRVPLPCIPVVNMPSVQKGSVALGYIGDYTPTEPPMVPPLIVHCVNEIERRGLTEIGLYRVPGSEKEVRSLRARFLKQRGPPCLDDVDINVLCGTIKDFLYSLNEPLIPRVLWHEFTRAVDRSEDRTQRLYEVIADLPQPNRDTLAFMMVHLQKIAESKDCRMPIENLAKCLAPTIVGYSSETLSDHAILSETAQQAKVLEYLLKLPSGYWKSFLHEQQPQGKLQQTPSTDSLLRTREVVGSGGLFGNKHSARKIRKILATPPSRKY